MLRNDFAELGRLAAFVEDYARRVRLPPKATFAIELCLEEAVTNVIRHGAAEGRASSIVATLQREPDAVTLCIEDDGAPFDPTLVEPYVPPASLEEAKIGGLGLHLMREFSTYMRYERSADRNRLNMVFLLARYAPAAGEE